MASHTPGPWIIADDGTGSLYSTNSCTVTDDGNSDLYELHARITGVSKGEVLANARLIAAAPDLLRACKALLLTLKQIDAGCVFSDEIYGLESVILQAEGGAQ